MSRSDETRPHGALVLPEETDLEQAKEKWAERVCTDGSFKDTPVIGSAFRTDEWEKYFAVMQISSDEEKGREYLALVRAGVVRAGGTPPTDAAVALMKTFDEWAAQAKSRIGEELARMEAKQ